MTIAKDERIYEIYRETWGEKGRTLFEWALRIKTFWTTDKAFLHMSTRARGQKRDESATTKGDDRYRCSQNRTAKGQSNGRAARERRWRELGLDMTLHDVWLNINHRKA